MPASTGATRNLSTVQTLNPATACMAGLAAQECGDHALAVTHFERALQLAPALIDVRLLLAYAKGASGDSAGARMVLDETPDLRTLPHADQRRLADAAVQLGATRTALKIVRALLQHSVNEPELHATLGALLHQTGALEEAEHVLERAVLKWPKHINVLLNSAHLLAAGGSYHQALCEYDRALAIAPVHHSARWHRGMLRLMLGDWAGGWSDHESRRALAVHKVKVPANLPAWDGRDARGLTLLLWGEQGLGDQIQGVRFATHLAALGATVVVRTAPALRRLFEGAAGVATVVADGEPLPACDAHVPMLSVPFLLKLHDESSLEVNRYLHVPGAFNGTTLFRAGVRMHQRARAHVGAVWAGSPGHSNDARRSLPQSLLPTLLEGTSTQWVSLQVGARSTEIDSLSPTLRSQVTNAAPMLTDFVDTAAVLAALDRVVTVDTSVAHLAGALGIPTLLLTPFVPDWRWQLVREDTPWYGSIRLLRQPSAGDWHSVVVRAQRELAAGGQAWAA